MKISMRQYFTDPETRSKAERFHAAQPLAAQAEESALKTAIPSEVFFGNVRIAPATILAPMAGVTDTVFRRFIKHTSFDPNVGQPGERGASAGSREQSAKSLATEPFEKSACGLIMTEFTSADGIYRCRESKRKRYLHFYEDEHPISAQLFGSNPEILAEAAKIVEDSGFDIVDLNLGCPAKKVVKCNGGSGLLRDLPLIRTIFETVRAAVKIPFTVKFRMGWNDSEIVCVQLAKLAEDCGLQAVALHARTREQGYSGNARWEWIAAVKDAVNIPVVGNGDIRTPEDAALMVAKTNCDAVMIGRTAPSNPWIFRQIAQYNANIAAGRTPADGPLYDSPSELDRYHMMKDYFTRLIEEEVSYGALGKMKQFASWFTHGVPGGANLRKAVYEAKHEREVLDAVDCFFIDRVAAADLGCSDEQRPSEHALESMQFADCG
jgi:nifR3 family TIM-barrel protein